MELAWLEDFVALVHTENFSRAATMRNVSQPAFSRRIQALENWLGVPLFIRNKQGVELTAAGEEFKIEAYSVIRDLYRIRKSVVEVTSRENATLHFAATHTLSNTFFPHWISQFEELTVSGDIYLVSDTMASCEQALIQGKAQFLLSYYHPKAPYSFSSGDYPRYCIGDDTLIPLSAPQEDVSTPLWSLSDHHEAPVRCLRYSEASGLSRILETNALYQKNKFNHKSQFTSHLASVLLSLACEGKGIAWLPYQLAEQAIKEKRLVRAGGHEWDIPLEICLYRSTEKLCSVAEGFWKRATKLL